MPTYGRIKLRKAARGKPSSSKTSKQGKNNKKTKHLQNTNKMHTKHKTRKTKNRNIRKEAKMLVNQAKVDQKLLKSHLSMTAWNLAFSP